MGKSKGDKVSIPWTGKMMAPRDCDKLYVCNIMPTATTKKAIRRDTFKNTIDKYKWNSKKWPRNPQESRKKRETKNWENKKKTKK